MSNREKEPTQNIINMGAYMTEARNLLFSRTYGGLTNSTAVGYVAYAIIEHEAALASLNKNKVTRKLIVNMDHQAPLGLLWKAHNMLAANVTMNPCVYGEAGGIIAKAHKLFRAFHTALGYREIKDSDFLKAERPGVGGGGGR